MECHICERGETESLCSTCSHELGPFQYFMSELTGEPWEDFDMCLPLDPGYVRVAKAFFCGQQTEFDVNEARQIIRVDRPIYRPLTMEEQDRYSL